MMLYHAARRSGVFSEGFVGTDVQRGTENK